MKTLSKHFLAVRARFIHFFNIVLPLLEVFILGRQRIDQKKMKGWGEGEETLYYIILIV